MHSASIRSATKAEAHASNFTQQLSLRKIQRSAEQNGKDNLFGRQNEDLNKVYKMYRQEYLILAEYKMIQTENIQGVYVIPSRENSLLWFGVIFVRSGLYEDGVFRFTMLLDENFPDGEHPKVIFQCNMYHPVIAADTNELNLTNAFPTWNKAEQHLWQVLKFIQWIFYNVEASIEYSVNPEAADLFKNNREAFTEKAKEVVGSSKEHLYDIPPTEDKHYITFEPYEAETHEREKAKMLNYNDVSKEKEAGHSWVLPGSYKPLARPPSPPSDGES